MTGRLHVCSLARVREVAAAIDAGSVMSLLSPEGAAPPRFEGLAPDRHLVVGISDIVAPKEGLTQAQHHHVAVMLEFFRCWDRAAPMLVHCYAGVSRSTAAAFIGVCALAPDRSEREVAH